VGVVHQPVEDGIAKRGVPDAGVPVVDRQLTGDQRGAAPDPILDQFKEVAPFAVAEWGQAPVVEDEQIDLGQGLHQLPVGAVGARVHELLAEEAREAHIAHGVALPTRHVPERTREPRLAGAGWPDDE